MGVEVSYQLSNFLIFFNYLFFVLTFISLIFILLVINKKINNFILIIIFLMMNPQLSIYHRYYDPLILLTFYFSLIIRFLRKKY